MLAYNNAARSRCVACVCVLLSALLVARCSATSIAVCISPSAAEYATASTLVVATITDPAADPLTARVDLALRNATVGDALPLEGWGWDTQRPTRILTRGSGSHCYDGFAFHTGDYHAYYRFVARNLSLLLNVSLGVLDGTCADSIVDPASRDQRKCHCAPAGTCPDTGCRWVDRNRRYGISESRTHTCFMRDERGGCIEEVAQFCEVDCAAHDHCPTSPQGHCERDAMTNTCVPTPCYRRSTAADCATRGDNCWWDAAQQRCRQGESCSVSTFGFHYIGRAGWELCAKRPCPHLTTAAACLDRSPACAWDWASDTCYSEHCRDIAQGGAEHCVASGDERWNYAACTALSPSVCPTDLCRLVAAVEHGPLVCRYRPCEDLPTERRCTAHPGRCEWTAAGRCVAPCENHVDTAACAADTRCAVGRSGDCGPVASCFDLRNADACAAYTDRCVWLGEWSPKGMRGRCVDIRCEDAPPPCPADRCAPWYLERERSVCLPTGCRERRTEAACRDDVFMRRDVSNARNGGGLGMRCEDKSCAVGCEWVRDDALGGHVCRETSDAPCAEYRVHADSQAGMGGHRGPSSYDITSYCPYPRCVAMAVPTTEHSPTWRHAGDFWHCTENINCTFITTAADCAALGDGRRCVWSPATAACRPRCGALTSAAECATDAVACEWDGVACGSRACYCLSDEAVCAGRGDCAWTEGRCRPLPCGQLTSAAVQQLKRRDCSCGWLHECQQSSYGDGVLCHRAASPEACLALASHCALDVAAGVCRYRAKCGSANGTGWNGCRAVGPQCTTSGDDGCVAFPCGTDELSSDVYSDASMACLRHPPTPSSLPDEL